MPTLDDCYQWQSGGCWTIRNLWHWMSSFGCLDVIVLALMLVFLFAIVIHVCCRYYLTGRDRGIDNASTRALASALKIEMGALKSIAITAPYLGLAGTCVGILGAFRGIDMEIHAAMVLIETLIALALIPTALAIAVAVLATCSYNFLCTRIDLRGGEGFGEGQQRDRHCRGVRGFPPAKRFSELPAFGLLAAPVLAMAIAWFMTLAPFHPPTGFYVEFTSKYDVVGRFIILRITDTGKLFLNQEQEDRISLADRLSEIYGMRKDRTLYLIADSNVPFQTVADALDTVEGAKGRPQAAGMIKDELHINVRVVTPKVLNAGWPIPVVMTGSGQHVSR